MRGTANYPGFLKLLKETYSISASLPCSSTEIRQQAAIEYSIAAIQRLNRLSRYVIMNNNRPYQNPPSEDKLRDLRENLVVFNFMDHSIWAPDGNSNTGQFFDYDDQSFKGIVSSLGRNIVSGETVDVCSVCREVKGANSRLKAGGKCMVCDIGWSKAAESIEKYADKYREAKMR